MIRKQQSTPDIQRLWNSAGFFDPLSTLSQTDLVGSVALPGSYYRMRLEHPVISSVMDSRKAFLRSLSFEFQGKNGDRVTEYWNRNVKSGKPNSPVNYPFASFFSDMVDCRDSYGFSIHEISILPTENKTYLWPISPLTVSRFIEKKDENVMELENIEFFTGLQFAPRSADIYAHFANDIYSNNWWGISILRPLLNRWLAYQQCLKTFMEQQPLERGILYAQENGEGSTEQAGPAVDEFLTDILGGENRTARLPEGIDLKFIQAGSSKSTTDEFLKFSDNFDEQVRGVLNQNLDSLGLASHGSRALGETISISDDKKFEAWLEAALAEVMASPMMRAICSLCEANPDDLEIITVGITDTKATIDVDGIYAAISNGLLTPDQLGQKNIERIIAATGLSVEDLKLTPAAPVTALSEPPTGPTTHPTAPAVIKAASRALAAYHALPTTQRPPIAARDLGLFRRLTTGEPLTPQAVAQLDAFLDLHQDFPIGDFISIDLRSFVDGIFGENE